jgi:D-galactarolactone cycloisomerase
MRGETMIIENIETFLVRIPFDTGGKKRELGGKTWQTLDYVFIRIDTDTGISGWGDAFGYGAAQATKAVLDHMITPGLIGADLSDIDAIHSQLQRDNHLYGRYGITMFAISGIDIALWDIAGKAAGLPLHQMLGGKVRDGLPAYASLFRYGDPEQVAAATAKVVNEGFSHIKLHEIGIAEVKSCRQTSGDDMAIMLDVNCAWDVEGARDMARQLADFDLFWFEEPVFPPEDFKALARLKDQGGIAIAAGENACTAFEFDQIFAAGAVTYAQPSVTKVGGISQFRKILAAAKTADVKVMPHSPYFGPGLLATLHLAAAMEEESLIEYFYLQPEALPMGKWSLPEGDVFRVPDGPGLGCDPDPDVMRDYVVKGS